MFREKFIKNTILEPTKEFKKNLVKVKSIERIDTPSGRLYKSPEGFLYPSVTTVLSWYKQDALKPWRERVGEEQAAVIMNKAAARGTHLHTLCEDYLNNTSIDMRTLDYASRLRIKGIQPYLNRINNIRGIELQLYSNYLKLAGTADVIGDYDGKLSLIDFKTSTFIKERSMIETYFMQTACYCVMFEEQTGIPITNLVILMVDDSGEAREFLEKRDDWIFKAIKVRKDYDKFLLTQKIK